MGGRKNKKPDEHNSRYSTAAPRCSCCMSSLRTYIGFGMLSREHNSFCAATSSAVFGRSRMILMTLPMLSSTRSSSSLCFDCTPPSLPSSYRLISSAWRFFGGDTSNSVRFDEAEAHADGLGASGTTKVDSRSNGSSAGEMCSTTTTGRDILRGLDRRGDSVRQLVGVTPPPPPLVRDALPGELRL